MADTVVAIESGRRQINVDEFLMIPQLLSATYHELGANPDKQDVTVGMGPLPASAWRDLISGDTAMYGLDKLRDFMGVNRDSANEAEKKAARSLGMSAHDLDLLAHDLWNLGLTDERDRRLRAELGDVELPKAQRKALRGHITRRLLAELRVAREGKP